MWQGGVIWVSKSWKDGGMEIISSKSIHKDGSKDCSFWEEYLSRESKRFYNSDLSSIRIARNYQYSYQSMINWLIQQAHTR